MQLAARRAREPAQYAVNQLRCSPGQACFRPDPIVNTDGPGRTLAAKQLVIGVREVVAKHVDDRHRIDLRKSHAYALDGLDRIDSVLRPRGPEFENRELTISASPRLDKSGDMSRMALHERHKRGRGRGLEVPAAMGSPKLESQSSTDISPPVASKQRQWC